MKEILNLNEGNELKDGNDFLSHMLLKIERIIILGGGVIALFLLILCATWLSGAAPKLFLIP